jgi:hypothetical protein
VPHHQGENPVNYFIEVTKVSDTHGVPDQRMLVAIHDIARVLPELPGLRKRVLLVLSTGEMNTPIKEKYDALIQLLLKSDGAAIGR